MRYAHPTILRGREGQAIQGTAKDASMSVSTSASDKTAADDAPATTLALPARTLFFAYLLGLLTAFTMTGVGLFFLRRPDPPPIQLMAPPTATPTASATATPTLAPIVVYVSGAVNTPGTFTLAPAARIADAIAAAGGLAGGADAALVNQAERLFDGAQIHVPMAGTSPDIGAPAPGLSGLQPTPTPAMRPADIDAASGARIELNTATQAELESLPGIGASKAQGIIANRPYATVDDLERVPGIGPATIERLRPLVVVRP